MSPRAAAGQLARPVAVAATQVGVLDEVGGGPARVGDDQPLGEVWRRVLADQRVVPEDGVPDVGPQRALCRRRPVAVAPPQDSVETQPVLVDEAVQCSQSGKSESSCAPDSRGDR